MSDRTGRQAAAGTPSAGPDEASALADLDALAPAADRARLAGVAASRPLMMARAAQLQREAYRAQARFGENDPRAQELALKSERHALRIARFDTEIARAQVTTPAANPNATVIWGRVSESGKPKAGVTVSARGAKGDVQAFDCTDAVGGFAMTVPGQGTVQLRVNDAKDAVLYAGTESIAISPGAVFFRDIRIGEQPVDICQRPADDSGGDARPGMVRVPDIVGRSEAEAVRLLTAVGLKMGDRTEVQSDKPAGQIVKQLPDANAEVAPGSAVTIEVAARTDRVVPRLVGLHLSEAKAALDKSGLGADLAFRTNPQHAGIVLTQDPHEGARIDPKQGVELAVGLPEKPVPPRLVLDLVTLDARFKAVRLAGQPLSARAQQLGLRDRHVLAEFAGAEDAKVRDALGLPALRDAQIVKRILRDLLAKTE